MGLDHLLTYLLPCLFTLFQSLIILSCLSLALTANGSFTLISPFHQMCHRPAELSLNASRISPMATSGRTVPANAVLTCGWPHWWKYWINKKTKQQNERTRPFCNGNTPRPWCRCLCEVPADCHNAPQCHSGLHYVLITPRFCSTRLIRGRDALMSSAIYKPLFSEVVRRVRIDDRKSTVDVRERPLFVWERILVW